MKKIPYEIVYEDESILVVYKNRDVFSVATDDIKTKNHNLFFYLKRYAASNGEKVFLVHRLDYETSGIMIFAKNYETQQYLKDCFENRTVIRLYEAVVKEKLQDSYHKEVNLKLSQNESGKVYIDDVSGKEAITIVDYLNPIQIGSALKIEIKTGRKNQIRISLHSLGLTLIGDKRYSSDIAKRMYLNAYSLSFPKNDILKKNEFFINPLWIKL